ncbi:MAG TPA: hypothetical protein VFT95_05780 [Micromonosporaceae bacterium]|nr:hypothetical protein [Micromonosporaceae bacterium]
MAAAGSSWNGDTNASVSTEELLAGIPVTDEGQARARRELDEFDQRWTAERWAALRDRLGIAPKPAAG